MSQKAEYVFKRLENLSQAIEWLGKEGGEASFGNNSVVIRCAGLADMCSFDTVAHDASQVLFIAIQRVYMKARDESIRGKAKSRSGIKGGQISVTGSSRARIKPIKPDFDIRPAKPSP